MSLPALRELLKKNAWRATADGIVRSQQHIEASTIDFATFWIESGHRVREQVSDDKLLSSMLRQLLPPYEGDDATLYRGENRVLPANLHEMMPQSR